MECGTSVLSAPPACGWDLARTRPSRTRCMEDVAANGLHKEWIGEFASPYARGPELQWPTLPPPHCHGRMPTLRSPRSLIHSNAPLLCRRLVRIPQAEE